MSDHSGLQRPIILVGFMGTGKSTAGTLIAQELGWRFADTDGVISERTGYTVAEIFETQGEAAFRALEAALCAEIRTWERTVIATGGGILLNPVNRAQLLAAGTVVCLRANPETIAARVAAETHRPLLSGTDPQARIRAILSARQAIYDSIPIQIETTNMTPAGVAQKVIEVWRSIQLH